MAIEGVWPIVATPFDESGEIDYPSLRNEIQRMAQGGCHGVILFGFASEFYKLTDEEMREIVQVSVEECDSADLPLFVSITQHATTVAEQWAEEVEAAGADGLMLLPPFMMNPSESDIYTHIKRVAEAVSIPLLVQYAPDNTGVSIKPEVFARLSEEVDNIPYYKVESKPPGGYTSELLKQTEDSVDILVGSAGRQMIEAYDRGAVGVIPGGALHEIYLNIHESHMNDDRDRAVELHRELIPLLDHIGQAGEMFMHYEKRMLEHRNFIESAHCRIPSFTPDEHYDNIFDEQFDRLTEYL